MTRGQIELFYARLETAIRSNGYETIKDFITEGNMGIAYPTYQSKKSIGRMPTPKSIDKVCQKLNLSADYLLYGKTERTPKATPVLTDEDIDIIKAYNSADRFTKIAIKALLGKKQ